VKNTADSEAGSTTKTIPSQSFVSAVTLHGVACPIEGNLNQSVLAAQVPIVMPISGVFHSPDKHTYTLGTASLLGFCVGVDSDIRPHAIIKIEQLSYVGPDGHSQKITVNGYIIDRRDNQEGVMGTKYSEKGKVIAEQAAAAALQAVGGIAQSGATTQTQTPLGGFQAVLNPSQIGTAALGGAFSNAAGSYAQYFKDKAASMFDVIMVPANVPINFVTTDEIQYISYNTAKPANQGDDDEGPGL
jgi:hypothetical protein